MAREYKDSGIEWIGLIPKEWEICQLKRLLSFQNGQDYKHVESDSGYPVYGSGGVFKYATNYLYDGEAVLFGRKGTIDKPLYVKGKFWTVDTMYYATPFFGNNGKLLYYLATLLPFDKYQTSTALPSMTQSLLGNMCVVSPPLPEQQKIADYLDKVCGEADEMIALQEKMIEELKAYKQSIITEVVTKGLNPNVPMKNSGIDWIGEIPEHWRLEPLKYCFGRRSEKNYPVKTEERLSLSIDKGVTLYAEKTTNLDRFKDDFTQYQIAYPNDIVLNCMNMIVGAVGLSNYMGCVSPVYYVIYPSKQDVNPLYYSYLLNIPTIRGVYYSLGKGIYAIERGEGRVNTCRLKVSYNDFGRLEIPVPPVKEQKAITQYIQEKCSEIDSLIAIKQQKISELKEYKKSVIYEYVTGKKEVV